MVQGQLREGVQSKLLVAVEEVCYVLKYQILPIIPHQATATPSDGAKMFGVLYTTSQSTSLASLECSRKNFRFGEAPSFTAAHTCRLSDTSKTATVLQKRGIIWNNVTFPVKKYAMICFKSVHNPLTRNAKAWVASVRLAKLVIGSPKSIKPIRSPETLSNTRFDCIFISSITTATYLCTGVKDEVFAQRLSTFSLLMPAFGLKWLL